MLTIDDSLTDILLEVSKCLHENNLSLVSAESCTGGWVAKKMTDIAGSSAIFDRGFITYSNQAKQEMLDVSEDTLNNYGAVSEEVVKQMVEGAIKYSQADIAVSISGVAGPGGGTKDKPVGMVCFGWKLRGATATAKTFFLEGNRNSVRKQSVKCSLLGASKLIEGITIA